MVPNHGQVSLSAQPRRCSGRSACGSDLLPAATGAQHPSEAVGHGMVSHLVTSSRDLESTAVSVLGLPSARRKLKVLFSRFTTETLEALYGWSLALKRRCQ